MNIKPAYSSTLQTSIIDLTLRYNHGSANDGYYEQ